MRDFLIFILFVIICIMGVGLSIGNTRLKNIERKYCKIEQAYDKMIEENEKLIRMNEQSLRLLAEGGWDHE